MGTLSKLSYDECLRRLDAGGVGRVAITEHALPAIVPVNYVRSGECLLFRTESGGMLAHGCDGSVVAFEIDGVDPNGTAGWSVLVIGTAQLLDGAGSADASRDRIRSALGAGRDQLIAVTLGQVSGREILAAPAAA